MSAGRNFGLAIVLSLMILDGVHWVGFKLREAFGESTHLQPAGPEPVQRTD